MKIFNKRAKFDYFLQEKFEAGIALTGSEVKSLKEGGEAWLYGANIPLYAHTSVEYDPLRPRKLLLHKKEIISIGTKAKQQNLTLVPISVYTKGRLVKVQIALAKGKKQYEKRDARRKKDIELDIKRALREK